MPYLKGGEYITDALIRARIPYVFGICGHGNVGLLDALYDRQDEIKLVSPRHEQVAGHMADAYFRVCHRPAAVLASIGPGAANLVMPLANAFLDSSAMLAITANAPTGQQGRGAFQELYRFHQADFPSVLRPCVKRSFQAHTVEMLPLALRQALSLATCGRPGPVHLDIPFDVFQDAAELTHEPAQPEQLRGRTGAAPEDVRRAVDLLEGAERPLIYTGHGATLAEAGPELTKLVELLQVPVVSLPNGLGVLDMRHPLALGFVGRNGAYPANEAARRCDVLLDLGARFDDRSASSWIPGYSWNIPPTQLIQVDIDPAELGRNYPVALGVAADVRAFLQQILEEIERRGAPERARSEPWRRAIAEWRSRWERYVAPHFSSGTSPIRPERVVRDVRSALPDDGILLLDVGAHHNWFMQFWEARRPQAMLNAYGFGGMGFGVAGALGAKLAAPERPCLAVVGDGGFTMTPHVLATAVEYDIPAVWLIWNNFGWTSIRDIQLGVFNGRELGTMFYHGGEPYNPDFDMMARSYGVEGLKVSEPDELHDALTHALGLGRPCVLDVHVDGDVRPPATGAWQLPPNAYAQPAFGERYLPEGGGS